MPENSSLKSIKNEFLTVIKTTTFHGFSKICNSRVLFFKVFWTSITVATLSVFSFEVVRILQSYFAFNVITSIKIYKEIPSNFPNVAFCNLDLYTDENTLNLAKHLAKQENISVTNSIQLDEIKYFVTNKLFAEKQWSMKPPKESVIFCRYNKKVCDETIEYSWLFSMYYGRCWVFKPREKLKVAGYKDGFEIELFMDPARADNVFTPTRGLHVFIYNSSTRPVETDGIDISVGLDTSIAVRRIFTEKLSDPFNDCIPDKIDSEYARYLTRQNITYRQIYCHEVCKEKLMEQVCGCHYYHSFTDPNEPLLLRDCDAADYNCTITFSNVFRSDLDRYCGQQCPEECNSLTYELSSFSTKYHTGGYLTQVQNESLVRSKYPNMTMDELKDNIVKFRVFYPELEYEVISQNQQYTLSDTISNLGGSMGLLLGASLISLLEIVELSLNVFFMAWTMTKPKAKKSSHNINPRK